MIPTFASKPQIPFERGSEFGHRFAREISRNVEVYHRLFCLGGNLSVSSIRELASSLEKSLTPAFPELLDEMRGMAHGSGISLEDILSLNARTEILAASGQAIPQECSVIVKLPSDDGEPVVAMQNWDWLCEIENGWLLWTIELPNGHRFKTLTEFGILAKIGVSSLRVGLLINILSSRQDGATPIGLPIHLAARAILSEPDDLNETIRRVVKNSFSSSSCLSIIAAEKSDCSALSMEISPRGFAFVLPDSNGLLAHTNHFVDQTYAADDLAPLNGSSSFFRLDLIRRGMAKEGVRPNDRALRLLSSHLGGSHAICCHAPRDASFGRRGATLATVQVDLLGCALSARRGGGCGSHEWTTV